MTKQIISAKQSKIPKKRWPERCRSWLFDGKTGQLYWSLNRKWPFIQSSSKERCHRNFVNRFWHEHDLYFLRYGQRRNALIENLYDLNFPSKKYCRRPDILGDCGRWIALCRRKTHSIILHTWCSLSLSTKSEDRPIRKNSTSCKQHLNAGPSVKPQVTQARNMSIGEHRRVSASIGELRHCCVTLGKKPIVSVISGRFMGFYVNGFL